MTIRSAKITVQTGACRPGSRFLCDAGVPYVHFYLSADAAPHDPDERQTAWNGLVAIYRELGQIAADAGVQISTHTFHVPDRLIWNQETFGNLRPKPTRLPRA